MRLHVVSLPHTQTTKAYSACAYTEKVRKFCTMMTNLGHTIFLYAGEENEAKCAEHICCISKKKQKKSGFKGPEDYLSIDFNSLEPWNYFHKNVAEEILERIEPTDIICVITGTPTNALTPVFPENPIVEFGVGYTGISHSYRVFESHAWRNFVYGQKHWDGQFFDEVIPNYFEVDDFPFVRAGLREDYFLYIGRLTEKKGWRIAQDVCERLGKKLVVAGPGEFDGYGNYMGTVNPKTRGLLMAHAKAVFVPTTYIGPFEGVHIEANLCGTPVITTDFGVFTETVENKINGIRCKMFKDFMSAAEYYDKEPIDYQGIRQQAIFKYSTEVVAKQYEDYFERLATLRGDGWYSK